MPKSRGIAAWLSYIVLTAMTAASFQTSRSIRIIALGDSTTAGTPGWKSPLEAPPAGAGDETSQYAYWLMRDHPNWDVRNRGVNGERSDQIRARFSRDVIDAHPRLVIIIAGVNDVYQGRTVDDVTANLHWMYEQAIRAGIRVLAGTIVPFNTARPDQNERMHAINRWIREQSMRDPQLGFVDTRAAVAAADNPDLLMDSPDRLHPSAAGYRRMADAIGRALEAMLR
jgi:lysophospholipase L1-like esterase